MKTSEKVIGSNTYRVTALGALKGRSVFVMLVRLLGASAEGLQKASLAGAIPYIAANLTDADMASLCDTFGKVSDVVLPDGRAPRVADVFDLHFSDNYLEMVQWLMFCLEVNFSSFFRGLTAKAVSVDSAKQAAKAPGQ